jgi:hypothetical protein
MIDRTKGIDFSLTGSERFHFDLLHCSCRILPYRILAEVGLWR